MTNQSRSWRSAQQPPCFPHAFVLDFKKEEGKEGREGEREEEKKERKMKKGKNEKKEKERLRRSREAEERDDRHLWGLKLHLRVTLDRALSSGDSLSAPDPSFTRQLVGSSLRLPWGVEDQQCLIFYLVPSLCPWTASSQQL